jgi:hypothetical protein
VLEFGCRQGVVTTIVDGILQNGWLDVDLADPSQLALVGRLLASLGCPGHGRLPNDRASLEGPSVAIVMLCHQMQMAPQVVTGQPWVEHQRR